MNGNGPELDPNKTNAPADSGDDIGQIFEMLNSRRKARRESESAPEVRQAQSQQPRQAQSQQPRPVQSQQPRQAQSQQPRQAQSQQPRQVKDASPREITPEERARRIAARRAAEERNEAQRREAAKLAEEKRRERREKIHLIARDALGYFLVFLCMFLIIAGTAMTIFLLTLGKKSPDIPVNTDGMTYNISDSSTNLPYDKYMVGNVMYLDFNDIALLCDMSVSGDSGNQIFTTTSGEFVSFTVGSRDARVNGSPLMLDGEVILRADDVWVPLSFIRDYITGLSVTVSQDEKSISVNRKMTDGDTGYLPVAFTLKSSDTLNTISDSSLPTPPVTMPSDTPKYTFNNDLSSFLMYMDPADRDAYLTLVNQESTVDPSYIPTDLVGVVNTRNDGRDTQQMRLYAEKALEALFIEMYSAGYTDVSVTSAYRSYDRQSYLYNVYLGNEKNYYAYNFAKTGKGRWFSDDAFKVLGESYIEKNYISKGITVLTNDDAKRVTLSYSAYPGTSEHQTGLCCDMHNLPSATEAFAEKAAYKWLRDNAYKFGFILRFPEDKTAITGYSFEPWHYRFVGQYHAAIMHDKGMCLEEYIAWIGGGR